MSTSYLVTNLEVANAEIPEMETGTNDFHLGQTADIDSQNIQVRIAEFPEIINFYHLLKKSGAEITQEVDELVSRFDLYILTHSVGIVDRNKIGKIDQLGYRLATLNGLRLQNRVLLPETQFIKPKISGGFTFNASVKTNGEMKIPENAIQIKKLPLKLNTSGEANASLNSDLSIDFALPTLSPIIQTIGKFSSYAEWCIDFNNTPLVGDQVFIQSIAVEKGTEEILFEVSTYVTIQTFGIFKSRRESKPSVLKVKCPLRPNPEI